MVSSSSLQLIVERCEPELITPSHPTPCEIKYLSDLDNQEVLRFHVSNLFFYRKNEEQKGKDPVQVIRQAIAKTLVHYYPFAGRLREGLNRKLMVECTGEGVLFVEANANVAFEYFPDPLLPPFPAVEELLYDVPGSSGVLNCPLLLIQVTRLTCGGFIFALRLNHTMSDAPGLVQLLNAMTEMARGLHVPSVEPAWNRELLMARNPPQVTCVHTGYVEVQGRPNIMLSDDMVRRTFFFGPKETSNLKNHVPSHLRSCSTFEIVTACLWRCRTIALGTHEPNDLVRLRCVVNVCNMLYPPSPVGYYGNVIAASFAEARVRKLCENPLGYALDLVKKAKSNITDEYIRSLVDYLEKEGKPFVDTLGCYCISDVRHVGFGGVDFGWGKPVYGGPADGEGFPGLASFYLPMKNNEGEDVLVFTISLPGPAMELFVIEVNRLTRSPAANQGVPRITKFPVSSAL